MCTSGIARFTYSVTATVAAIAVVGGLSTGAVAQMNDKWITVVTQNEPPDLDPCNSSRSFQGRVLLQNIVETLLLKDPDTNELQPHLATSWEQVDEYSWRFKLREGVRFHDGEPFNAEALKYTFERTLAPGSTCGNRTKFFGDLKLEVIPEGEHSVLLKTDKPSPILPMRMSAMAISSPNHAMDEVSLAPVGTGPYRFDHWQSDQEIVLVRNEDYWGPKPVIEGARYISRGESALRASMVTIGEADIALNIAPQDANDAEHDYSYLNSETTYLRIDVSRPPLDDKRVRLALNYAFNREAIRGSVLSQHVIPATQIVMPSIPGHNHDLDKKLYPYDPDRAKQLLAEAKADGVPLDNEILLVGRPTSYPNASEVMEAFLAMYRSIGLNVGLLNLEPGQYNDVHNKPFAEDRGPTLLQATHDNNFGDPVFSYPSKYSCAGSQAMICDEALDKRVADIANLGGAARVEAWNGILETLYDDIVPEVWMYHMVGYARVSSRIDFVPNVTTNAELRISTINFR